MRASQFWPEVQCRLVSADDAIGFRYAYESEGEKLESDRLSLYDAVPPDVVQLKAKLYEGESVTGYVNRSDPAIAILSREDSKNEALLRILLELFLFAFCSGLTAARLTGMDKWTVARAGREKKPSPVTKFCEFTVYTGLICSFVCCALVFLVNMPAPVLLQGFMYLGLTPFVRLALLMIYTTIRNFILIFTGGEPTAKQRYS